MQQGIVLPAGVHQSVHPLGQLRANLARRNKGQKQSQNRSLVGTIAW